MLDVKKALLTVIIHIIHIMEKKNILRHREKKTTTQRSVVMCKSVSRCRSIKLNEGVERTFGMSRLGRRVLL